MYEFARGPLVWIAFIAFFGGIAYRLVTTYLLAKKEKVVLPVMNAKYGGRSIRRWLIPFVPRNTRLHPVFTVVSFSFHICLLISPLFDMGHAVLWEQAWGFSWRTLPAWAADVMTLIVIFGCAFFFVRRLAEPQVRNVTALSDLVLVLLVASPFVTGFVAHQQWLSGDVMVTLHMVCGAAWLVAIPFTRLSHMIWFYFSRAFMGSEFGAVRNARDW